MTQTQAPARGGQFLTSVAVAAEVFVREDLSDEQRLFGQTALEFMQKEVLPVVQRLYEHDWTLTRQLLKKASDLDLLRLEIPPAYGGLGLDLISASYVGEQIAINPSFGGSLGAHTSIGTLPLVYFGTDEQKARYLPRLASGELVGAYALTEPQSGSDALAARTTATLTPDGRHYLLERPEDVDHQRRLRRSVHDLREGRRRQVHRVPGGALDGRDERARRDQARARRIVDDGADARQREGAGRERARHDRPGPQGRVQRAELRAREARRPQHVRRPHRR